jgi:hypothetical protein
MSEHGLRQFTCAGCGWTSSDIGTFPNLAIPLCCTCDSDAPMLSPGDLPTRDELCDECAQFAYGGGGVPGGGGPSVG